MIENYYHTSNVQQIKRIFNILISLLVFINQLIEIIQILFFLTRYHQSRFPF